MGIRRAYRKWRFKRNMRKMISFFLKLDKAMARRHPRWKRKQFWHDFVHSDEFRRGLRKAIPRLFLDDL